MVIVGVFTGTTVAMVDRGFTNRVQNIKRVEVAVAPAPPGGANYLIIGSDTRAFATDPGDQEAFGSPEQETGHRSDTMMVAHVEPGSQKTFVVSFPRDLMVDVPGLPGKNRINAAYANGEAQGVIDTLRENFNLEINHYLEIDFKSFEKIVDTIGAVPVYIPWVVRDELSGLRPFMYGPGCYPLDGATSLAWVRSRHLEIYEDGVWKDASPRADLDRIGRQQQFIRKLAGLAIQKSLDDPFLGVRLAEDVLQYVTADQSLSRDDVNALLRAFKTVDVNDPTSVRFETLPVDPDPDNPNVTLVPSADAEQVIEQLRTFGDNTPPPATVQPAQVKVRVDDNTGTNIGQSVVSKLSELGFRATGGTSTARTVDITELRYGYDGAAQAKALLTYFPDAKLVPDAKVKAGVRLVLGKSFPGTITVPTTTTTAPPSTVEGAPATSEPSSSSRSTTTTTQPQPLDLCPQ
jgi:LCP family protein required for cell wall assembly